MFFFGKKKAKEAAEVTPAASVNKEQIIKNAEAKANELESLTGEARVPVLNELGNLYFQAAELEKAAKFYEESLGTKREMGKTYTNLMSIYNKLRQQAAQNKDDEKMNYYMSKVQDMMQMSKDMLRGKA